MNFLLLYILSAFYTAPVTKPVKAAAPAAYPQGYFASPIDIPITLMGNFGEPRALHFHTGLDIRTNQEEGHKVFAAADGYISRINVSGAGYGNALYITHPNGYVTVYGHLQQFNATIMKRLRKEQYAKESFAVDFNLPAGEIPVKKGEVIALSGNTGGSGGPHLHFEIRDTAEFALNPMLFGFNLKDDIKPTVSSLKFYPEDELKGKCEGYRTNLIPNGNAYGVLGETMKFNSTKVGISVNTHDGINLTEARIGIYAMKMYDGSKLVYEYRMDRISFTDKRYVLSHIDYPVFLNEGHKTLHKCFVEPGNKCPVYSNLADRGIIDLADGKTHDIKIEVSDFAGNTSTIKFKMVLDKNIHVFNEKDFKYTGLFNYNKVNEYSTADMKIKIPVGCLFDDLYFKYSAIPSLDAKIFSKIHLVDNSTTQVFDWFTIGIKTENLPASLVSKAMLVCKDKNGANQPCGGKYENGFVTTRTRLFGTYFVKIDTTAPHVAALNVKPGRNMRAYKKMVFRINDNLSGVADFDTYIDGKWVVTDYDSKSSTLVHYLDSSLAVGSHTFKIVVTDERQNKAEYAIKFRM